jgi:hypothetical protein
MFNNRLRFIKHIQTKILVVLISLTKMIYQTPSMKYSWIFQNIKDNVNALTLNFWQTYIQCYELNKIMQHSDMFFIHTLNKFHIMSKNIEYIQFINSSCYQQSPINLIIPHLFYTNKLVQKYNENVH